jgi:HK97 family phage prohead protease
MDFKRFAPAEFKLDAAGMISVAFAQLNVVDSDGDVTLPGAFPAKAVPMSAYGHTSWDGALPVGKGDIAETDGWGVFKGQFLMDTTHGRDAYETVKAMAELQEWSYGYQPIEFSFGMHENQQVRFLKKLDVFEVSPVLKGAGVGTHTLAIKNGGPGPDAPYAEHATWVREAIKAFMDRTNERADWRAKEGRTLSGANRAELLAIAKALRDLSPIADELDALLASTDPEKSARQRAVQIEVLLDEARLLGVPI